VHPAHRRLQISPESTIPDALELRGLREENRTLYGVIKLVSSSAALEPMLQGVVDLATEATGCHACFIYLLHEGQLTIRAASPVFGEAVGNVRFSVQEGLTGWVARHRTPEFIRDQAMDDPRMKYVPLLQEERFQSMAAVPILSRAGETIGVIVLHTKAPHEFGEDTLKLLAHIASQQVAAASGTAELGPVLVQGMARLLDADVCQLLRLQADGETLSLLASVPETLGPPATLSAAELTLAAIEDRGIRPAARGLWPSLKVGDLLVTPLAAGERLGLMCAASTSDVVFSDEDAEIARAIAHLAAVAIKRAELIEGLTKANTIKDLFEALAAGATTFAAVKAAEVRCDLTAPYLMVCAEPAGMLDQSSVQWRSAAETLGQALAELAPRSAIEAGPGPVRALLSFGPGRGRPSEVLVRQCRELGHANGAAIGISETRAATADAAEAYREARDAATIARALVHDGGAIGYSQVGAYRYLVQIAADDAPRDRMRAAVDRLIAYDRRRRTALLDTLERYLSERRSVIESARALYIHPNTLRQRLGRIEELTGLELDTDDLLSLELAIKLARLHGRPDAG
jgi:GAF domain-containing protein